MSEKMTSEQISEAAADTIRNALNVEVKERFGEQFFVKHSMVVALVERPRGELEKPNAERFSLFLKSLTAIHPSIAVNMLKEAAARFQAKKAESGE